MAGVAAHAPAGAPPGLLRAGDRLPSWPFTLAFAGFPLWWFLGIVDFIWIPMAVVMVLYLVRTRATLTPRGTGVWLLFLVWAGCSVIQLTAAGQLLVFGYRYAIYLACTVLLVYLFNNRRTLTDRFVSGVLTIWWLITVLGGAAAMLLPTAVFRTPLSMILPGSLLGNPWINHMVIRRFNQFNPDSYFELDPRPSAPFLYTNNWGNVYSLLIPFVLIHLMHIRGTKRFWLLSAALVLSAVPAIVTLNRGMFIGLGIAAVYAAFRFALLRDLRAILALATVAAIGVGVWTLLPTEDSLAARTESRSTVDRATLYVQAVEAVRDSPILGYGRTIEGEDIRDPVGTQGQFWMVLVSHGVGATVLFMGWFLLAFVLSLRRRDPCGLAANTVLLVGTIEFTYYGAIPYGLPIMMIAAALALRGPVNAPEDAPVDAGVDARIDAPATGARSAAGSRAVGTKGEA
ncbi:hypothetical protein LEUCIP111803_00976 [Leucobacter soli]|uniref:O-antigen ligase-related domain-containing protein n=1 Tax=Leucobacter soli TaxID=2812850 RepID=A0A916JV71_9MICO|nr:O-antigen ligase family protein [Leucobacter soli]CAG7606969.1 hypothetical protein LEUCIP111803_00976 [Leucobacter soli]